MPNINTKTTKQLNRARRSRAKIRATSRRPRLSVFKSNLHIYAQVIDDARGATLAAASDRDLTATKKKLTGANRAAAVGHLVATKAQAKKVTQVVFDRGGYRYAGQIKALADAARAAGLIF